MYLLSSKQHIEILLYFHVPSLWYGLWNLIYKFKRKLAFFKLLLLWFCQFLSNSIGYFLRDKALFKHYLQTVFLICYKFSVNYIFQTFLCFLLYTILHQLEESLFKLITNNLSFLCIEINISFKSIYPWCLIKLQLQVQLQIFFNARHLNKYNHGVWPNSNFRYSCKCF